MKAGVFNLYIEQGATFTQVVQVSGIDLTNYTARGMVRQKADDADPLVSFTIAIDSATQLTISLTETQTKALPADGEAYNDVYQATYDVELVHKTDSSVIRLINGFVSISPEVTK